MQEKCRGFIASYGIYGSQKMKAPWWRKQTGHWYIEQHGKQVRISKERDPDGETRKFPPAAVQNEWHRIMREGVPEDMQLGDLFVSFIASLPEDSDNRITTKRQLGRFERFVGKEMKAASSSPSTSRTTSRPRHGSRRASARSSTVSMRPSITLSARPPLLSWFVSRHKKQRRGGLHEKANPLRRRT